MAGLAERFYTARNHAYALRKQKRDDRDERRQKKTTHRRFDKRQDRNQKRGRRAQWIAWLKNHGSLLVAIALIIASTAVALPAQIEWFDKAMSLTRSVAAAGMIEGAAWFAAILYADSLRRLKPSRLARGATLVLALLAGVINFQHGLETNLTTAVTYALGSLLGVGAWEMYMHSRRQIAAGLTPEQRRMWWRRRLHFPKVMREMANIRATFGVAVSREQAFQWAYLRTHGQPTVPISTSDPLLQRLLHPHAPDAAAAVAGLDRDTGGTTAGLDRDTGAEPDAGGPHGGVAVADGDVPDVLNLGIDFDEIEQFANVSRPGAGESHPGGTAPGTTGTPGRDNDRDNRDRDSGVPGWDNRDRDNRDTGGTTAGTGRDSGGWDSRNKGAGQPVTREVPVEQDTTGTDRDTGTSGESRSESRSLSRSESHPGTTGSGATGGTTGSAATGEAGEAPHEVTANHSKKEMLIFRYWKLREAGIADPSRSDQVNFTAEGKDAGADRKYVKRIFEECTGGKHPMPDEINQEA